MAEVAWNAYLSTLSHVPIFDTDGLLDVINQALSSLDTFLPAGTVVSTRCIEEFRPDVDASVGIPLGWCLG